MSLITNLQSKVSNLSIKNVKYKDEIINKLAQKRTYLTVIDDISALITHYEQQIYSLQSKLNEAQERADNQIDRRRIAMWTYKIETLQSVIKDLS